MDKEHIGVFSGRQIKGLLTGIDGEHHLIHLRFALNLQSVIGDITGKCGKVKQIIKIFYQIITLHIFHHIDSRMKKFSKASCQCGMDGKP